MSFYARFPRVPTLVDCHAVCDALRAWDSIEGLVPVGYATLRSADSHLERVTARSLDPTERHVYESSRFDQAGLVPSQSQAHLPTSCAPLVYWLTDNSFTFSKHRTYACGLHEGFTRFTGDTEVINDFFADALLTTMGNVRGFLTDIGAEQVVLRFTRYGQPLPLSPSAAVVGQAVGDRLMGSQRRRTRQLHLV